jgi:hypothetical protein
LLTSDGIRVKPCYSSSRSNIYSISLQKFFANLPKVKIKFPLCFPSLFPICPGRGILTAANKIRCDIF